jgi:hypothetical protein
VDVSLPDVNAEQRKNVDGIAAAIREAGLSHVVVLSSWGAEVPERIGGVIACHWLEQLLNEIPALNAVYLRPVWSMENFLHQIRWYKRAGNRRGDAVPCDRDPGHRRRRLPAHDQL